MSEVITERNVIKFNRKSMNYYHFSNFYPSPVTIDGITYKNNEGAFQAYKCLQIEQRKEFTNLNGTEAKRLGRSVTMRPDWEDIKDEVMYSIVKNKFIQNDLLRSILLSTGISILVENTTGWHDNYWGECTCPKCVNLEHRNQLGKTLMRVRDELKNS